VVAIQSSLSITIGVHVNCDSEAVDVAAPIHRKGKATIKSAPMWYEVHTDSSEWKEGSYGDLYHMICMNCYTLLGVSVEESSPHCIRLLQSDFKLIVGPYARSSESFSAAIR